MTLFYFTFSIDFIKLYIYIERERVSYIYIYINCIFTNNNMDNFQTNLRYFNNTLSWKLYELRKNLNAKNFMSNYSVFKVR